MKKAFISGTINQGSAEEIRKLLSKIGYEGMTILTSEKKISIDMMIDRIEMLLRCDALITRDNLSGPNHATFKIEQSIARYLDIPVILFGPVENPASNDKRLNDLVAEAVLSEMRESGDEMQRK